jgi:hypothetical protein
MVSHVSTGSADIENREGGPMLASQVLFIDVQAICWEEGPQQHSAGAWIAQHNGGSKCCKTEVTIAEAA